jgi:hypothetical protein
VIVRLDDEPARNELQQAGYRLCLRRNTQHKPPADLAVYRKQI